MLKENQKTNKFSKFEQLEREIPKTAEFIENKRIKVIRVRKNDKAPQDAGYYDNETTLTQLQQHNGNFGVCVGFNHETGSSIGVIDIDGFKYATMPENLKRLIPKEKRAYFDSLSEYELEDLCQESKDYLLKLLLDLFDSPMVSESANGGYHIFIFNRTLQQDITNRDHYISQNLVFGEDCEIEELRGLHLMNSLEIFTNYKSKQVVLPTSSIIRKDGTTGVYRRKEHNKLANSWDTIGTVEDLAKTVKEGLKNKGLDWKLLDEITPEQPATKETSCNNSYVNNNYVNNNANLIGLDQIVDDDRLYLARKVGKLYEMTIKKNYHNTLGVSLSNGLKTQGLGDDVILSIIGMGLQLKHKEHYEEHFKQVKADLKSTTVKKTGFPTLIKDYPELEPVILEIKVKIKKIKAKIEKAKEESKQETYNEDLDDRVELRKNPSEMVNLEDAMALELELKEMGLINYLKTEINNIMVGDVKNILRKLLTAFNVMRGADSRYIVTRGVSGSGKSMEDNIVLDYLIPSLYVIRMNAPTYGAFTRYAEQNSEYYNRTLVFMGDLGSKDDIDEFRQIFKIFKILITDKYFNRPVMSSNNDYINNLKMKAKSCACVFSLLDDNNEFDEQINSRGLSCTPAEVDEDELLEFIIDTNLKDSPRFEAKENSIRELKRFKNYLLYKVTSEAVISNPWSYGIFKRIAKQTETPNRYINQLAFLFEAYCILTSYECEKLPNGQLMGTEAQVIDFFENIELERAMRPDVYEFLLLLKNGRARGTNGKITTKDGYKLDLIDDEGVKLKNMEDNILNDMAFKDLLTSSDNCAADLDGKKTNIFLNKLMKEYRLRADTGGTFFTVSDINKAYGKYKAVRDIANISTVLLDLTKGKNPYLGKLEEKYKGKNIYYALDSLKTLGKPFEITEKDKTEAKRYLKNNYYNKDRKTYEHAINLI